MSSYFQSIRRLKDSHFYINALASQFALWKATQDQVDNPIYKAFSRATTNRLIFKEQAAAPVLRGAEFWKPMVPSEPGPVGPIGAPPTGTITIMINFDHELEDRSGKKNHAIFEFTNDQLLFADGQNQDLSFAVNFNPNNNSTYDKLWIPFSNTTQIVYDTANGFSIFTRIMPTVITDLGTTSTPGPAPLSNRLIDFGGPKRNHVDQQLYVIWWGSGWNSGSDLSDKNTLKSHYNSIVASEYHDGLWQYNGTKHIASITHVDNTAFAVPSGSAVTFQEIIDCVLDTRTQGLIPQFTGTSDSGWNFDLTHLYLIHNPPNKEQPPGYAGATSRAQDPVTGISFNWSSIHSPRITRNLGYEIPGYNAIQTVEQAAIHELMHAYITPTVGGCTAGNGWLFSESGFCNNNQHGPPGTGCSSHLGGECKCGNRLRTLSGTNILVESYWSNMDGRCIAPGTETNWTHPPAVSTGPKIRRYIFQKLDDLDNGATAAIGDDGTVYFNVKKAGTEYKVKTGNAGVIVNQWADCWFTWDTATNTPTIYVNNVKYTTASTEALLWNNTHSHTILGNYNMGATIGQYRGRMDDFRLYRGALVEDAQVDNMAGNGLTITGGLNSPPNPDEGVFIVNRVKIDKQLENSTVFVPADVASGDVPAPTASFTTTSFSTTSFTI